MTLTLVLTLTGLACYYGPGHDMGNIAAYRGLTIPPGHYGIAHWDEDKLGWPGVLWAGGAAFDIVVVDYTHPRDLAYVRDEMNFIAEVGWNHAGEITGLRYDGKVPAVLQLWPPQAAGRHTWQ